MTRWGLVAMLVVGLAAQMPGQTPPTLTALERSQLEAALLRVDVAHLKRVQAEADEAQATETLQRMLKALQRPGYWLDVAGMRYTPVPVPVKQP